MRIFNNKFIAKFAEKQGIDDTDLREAVNRAENGLIDVDLGGGVIKQRIARQGQGKSGDYRSIILFKQSDKAFIVYALAKSNRANITREELAIFKQAADVYLNYSDEELAALQQQNTIQEITQ